MPAAADQRRCAVPIEMTEHRRFSREECTRRHTGARQLHRDDGTVPIACLIQFGVIDDMETAQHHKASHRVAAIARR